MNAMCHMFVLLDHKSKISDLLSPDEQCRSYVALFVCLIHARNNSGFFISNDRNCNLSPQRLKERYSDKKEINVFLTNKGGEKDKLTTQTDKKCSGNKINDCVII